MNVYLWIFPLAIWIPPCILNLSNNGKIFHNLLKVYLGWKQRIKWYFCVLIVPQVAMEIKNSVCFDGGLNCQALLLGCKTWLIFSKKSKKRFKYIVIKLLYFWNKNVIRSLLVFKIWKIFAKNIVNYHEIVNIYTYTLKKVLKVKESGKRNSV